MWMFAETAAALAFDRLSMRRGLPGRSPSLSLSLPTGSGNPFDLASAEDEVVHLVSVVLGDQCAVEGLLLIGNAGLAGPNDAVELPGGLLGAFHDRLQHAGNHLTILDRIDRVLVAVKAEHLDVLELALVLQRVDRSQGHFVVAGDDTLNIWVFGQQGLHFVLPSLPVPVGDLLADLLQVR